MFFNVFLIYLKGYSETLNYCLRAATKPNTSSIFFKIPVEIKKIDNNSNVNYKNYSK